MCFFVSDLLSLRTEEEWEEVRQRISDLPQDEALTAEFTKVLSTLLLFALPDLKVSVFVLQLRLDNYALSSPILGFKTFLSCICLFVSGSACHSCSLLQGRHETGGC